MFLESLAKKKEKSNAVYPLIYICIKITTHICNHDLYVCLWYCQHMLLNLKTLFMYCISQPLTRLRSNPVWHQGELKLWHVAWTQDKQNLPVNKRNCASLNREECVTLYY